MAKGTSGYFIICFTFYYIFWIINIFWRDQEKGKVLKETGNWIGGYLICVFSMCLIGKEPNTHNLFWEIYIIQSQMHCTTLKYILQYSCDQFASLVSVVTMVVGGAGILANCLNIFVLSRYRGNYLQGSLDMKLTWCQYVRKLAAIWYVDCRPKN